RGVGVQTGWRYRCRLGWGQSRPRPRPVKADPEAQAAFKQTREASKGQRCKRALPEQRSRAGRRGPTGGGSNRWGVAAGHARGQRRIVRVPHRFQWRYLLAFVHPASGRTHWQVSSGIHTAVMSVVVEYFARAVGAGPRQRSVLVLEQAGYHTSPLVQVPEGL